MSPQRTASRPPILLATTNLAKERTFRWLLEGLPLSPVTPGQLGLDSAPEEEGDTHEAIARLKAQQWSAAGGSVLAIASDGGLVIPALGGRWESRFTHRFAGPAADDAERVRRLLELLRPYQGAAREASWVEALAIADRGEVLASWELRGSTGVISEAPADEPLIPGFWAFSVWHFPQLGKSYNQLTPQEREALDDHWTRLRPMVQRFLHDHLARPMRGQQ
jgi:inosine/xanthosine triphosphate pyrophosphatase family protein